MKYLEIYTFEDNRKNLALDTSRHLLFGCQVQLVATRSASPAEEQRERTCEHVSVSLADGLKSVVAQRASETS